MSSLAKKFFKNTVFLTSSKLINMLIALVSLYFYTRILTSLELALIPVLEILSSLIGVISSMGVDLFVQRRMPNILNVDKNEARTLSRSYVMLLMVGVSLCCVLLFVLSVPISQVFFKSPDFSWQIRLLIPAIIVACWWNMLSQLFRGTSMFMHLACFSVISQVLHPVALLTLYAAMGTPGLIVGLALGKGLACLFCSFYMRDFMFGSFPWRKTLSYIKESWPYYAESCITYPMVYADRWFVGAFLTPVDLAIYYVPRAMFDKMRDLSKALNDVMMANMSIYRGDAFDKTQQVFRKLCRLCVFIFIPMSVSLISLSYYLIDMLAGPRYIAGAVPFGFLVISLLISGLFSPYYLGLLTWFDPKKRLIVVLTQSLSVFILTPLLGWLWGLDGIASSRIFVALTASLISVYFIHVSFSFKIDFSVFKAVLLPSCALSAAIVGGQLLFYSKLIVPVYAFAGFLFYSLLFLRQISKSDLDVLDEIMPKRLSWITLCIQRYRKFCRGKDPAVVL